MFVEKCSVLLFLTLICLASIVRSIPIASDSIIFPKSDDKPSLPVFVLTASPTPKAEKADLIKCLDLGDLMPAFNTTSGEFECYPLTERGPCKENELFVLTENGVDTKCVARKCPLKQVFFKGNCTNIGTVSKCPQGMEVLSNPHGEGDCECKFGLLPWEDKDGSTTCFQEFLRGPCPEDQQLENVDDKSVCRPSECPENQIRWSNGACFDPIECQDMDYQVTFDNDKMNLTCIGQLDIRTLLVVPMDCGDGGNINSNSECVNIDSEGNRRSPRLAKSKDFRRLLRSRI